MPLHQNIEPNTLTVDGRLLAPAELSSISEIEAFIESITEEARELLSRKTDSTTQLTTLYDQLATAENPYSLIDKIIVPQKPESLSAWQARVLNGLSHFIGQLKSQRSKDFVTELRETLSTISLAGQGEELYEAYLHALNTTWALYEEDAPDTILSSELREKIDKAERSSAIIDEQERDLQNKIANYKTEKNADFDLDEQYNLVKISKRSNNLTYSVIYVKNTDEEKNTAFALYRGDSARVLGEGGFGKVKLCQNIQTGDWMAIKIQSHVMKEPSQLENSVLANLQHFAGEATRDKKYYTIQTLLPGIDLQKYIDQKSNVTLADRLDIAQKASLLLKEFHTHYLHRDIKPGNFIWDEQTKTLNLCDFGMACTLVSQQDSVQDFSGSGTFLAPEIDDTIHRGKVSYSTKSDIYALGQTYRELFHNINNTPEKISMLIEHMTKAEPNERAKIDEIIDNLNEITLALTAANPQLPTAALNYKDTYMALIKSSVEEDELPTHCHSVQK